MSLQIEAEAIIYELMDTGAAWTEDLDRLRRLCQIAPVHRSERLQAWVVAGAEGSEAVRCDPRFEVCATRSANIAEQPRFALEDVEIAGHLIRRGELVLLPDCPCDTQ